MDLPLKEKLTCSMEPDDKSGLVGENHKEVVWLSIRKNANNQICPKWNRLLGARKPSNHRMNNYLAEI